MRPIVIVLIVVALAIAGVTAYLVNYVIQTASEEQVVVEQADSRVRVMVAARDLAAGEILKPEDLEWREWPQDGIRPDYVTAEQADASFGDFPLSAVKRAIAQGEPVTASKVFKRTDAGFLAGALTPGMRAVSIKTDEVTGASGFVLPGDRVDIILTQRIAEFDPQSQANVERNVAQTILENIRVLAIDQILDDVQTNAKTAETVTVEVTPSQSETLALATQMGRVTLTLRSLAIGEEAPLGPFQADFNVSRYLGRKIQTTNRVLVASRDLPEGTLMRQQDLDWTSLPARDLQPGFYIEGAVDLQRLRGAFLRTPLRKGDVILPTYLVFPDQDSFVFDTLAPGMRGYSILIDPQSIISGRVSAGEMVDVILTVTLDDQGSRALLKQRRFSETVLQNVRVLAIDRDFLPDSTWTLGQTAVLEVSLKQAEVLATAASMGDLSLALRGNTPGDRPGTLPYTSDFEVSQAATAFVWGLTVPQPPRSGEDSEDFGTSTAPQLAPIPAPTLAAPAPAPSAPQTGAATGGLGVKVKVYRAGGETTYEFSE